MKERCVMFARFVVCIIRGENCYKAIDDGCFRFQEIGSLIVEDGAIVRMAVSLTVLFVMIMCGRFAVVRTAMRRAALMLSMFF